MQLKRLSSLILASALVFAAACSDDEEPAATGDTLTVAEFEQMGSAYSELGSTVFQSVLDEFTAAVAGPPAGVAAQSQTSGTFSATAECPAGGTAGISASYAVTGETSAGLTVTQTMDDCAVVSDAEEIWVFNGDPHIRWTANVTRNPETEDFTFTATQSGGFNWMSADAEKEGGCRVTLNLSITGNLVVKNFTATLTGSVCGVSIEESFSYSPPPA